MIDELQVCYSPRVAFAAHSVGAHSVSKKRSNCITHRMWGYCTESAVAAPEDIDMQNVCV